MRQFSDLIFDLASLSWRVYFPRDGLILTLISPHWHSVMFIPSRVTVYAGGGGGRLLRGSSLPGIACSTHGRDGEGLLSSLPLPTLRVPEPETNVIVSEYDAVLVYYALVLVQSVLIIICTTSENFFFFYV